MKKKYTEIEVKNNYTYVSSFKLILSKNTLRGGIVHSSLAQASMKQLPPLIWQHTPRNPPTLLLLSIGERNISSFSMVLADQEREREIGGGGGKEG